MRLTTFTKITQTMQVCDLCPVYSMQYPTFSSCKENLHVIRQQNYKQLSFTYDVASVSMTLNIGTFKRLRVQCSIS